MISNEAVEAAVREVDRFVYKPPADELPSVEGHKNALMRAALEAAAPHMLFAPEGVSEAEANLRMLLTAMDHSPYWAEAREEGAHDALRTLLSALSSERERAERAERIRDQWRSTSVTIATEATEYVARAQAAEAKVKELLGLLAPFLPINAVDTRDYAELSFGDHQTQAMTMQPDDWIALSDAALRWTETQGEGE